MGKDIGFHIISQKSGGDFKKLLWVDQSNYKRTWYTVMHVEIQDSKDQPLSDENKINVTVR